MIRSPHDPAGIVIEDYLAALAIRLIGPRSARTAVLDELRDGLHEAAAAHAAIGLSPQAAADATIAEFGRPEDVSAAFAEELGTRQARRTVSSLLLTGPLVGVWWLLLLAPKPWRSTPVEVWTAIPVLPLVALGTVTGLAVLATTGGLTRWLPAASPPRALAGAQAVALTCLAGDLAVLTMLAASPQPVRAALATTAACASVIRLACSARVVQRCSRTRRFFPTPRPPRY
jgi:hypothetical protein